MTTTSPPPARKPHPADRKDANFLRIYRLCDNRVCRKTQACRGDSRNCLERYLDLVPRDVVMLLARMDELKAEGLTFDEALPQLEEEMRAHAAWLEALDAIEGKPGGRWLPEEARWAHQLKSRRRSLNGKGRQAATARAEGER